jgi:peptidyl-prolyl cis-trans isomerase C
MSALASVEANATRPPVSVNGVVIARAAIAHEAQNQPAQSPGEAVRLAGEALVIRELLLQEARRKAVTAVRHSDGERRRETEEEASIRAVIESEVVVPNPTEAELRRYYEANRGRFTAPAVSEARHILIAARRDDESGYAAAREQAEAILAELNALPERFAEFARTFSRCPSAASGGHLGQLLPGDTTPEFEAALSRLAEGEMTASPIEARYGFHIIRLERRTPGEVLPFAAVAEHIATYLVERSRRFATAQYVARLVAEADITGIEMAGAETLRVN